MLYQVIFIRTTAELSGKHISEDSGTINVYLSLGLLMGWLCRWCLSASTTCSSKPGYGWKHAVSPPI